MRTKLVMVGRTERGFVSDGFTHYLDRVAHWTKVAQTIVPASSNPRPDVQRKEEEAGLLKAIPSEGRIVVLDEGGAQLDSPAFAKRLGNWRDQGVREVTFVIGGAYGLTPSVRERADLVLSLSTMTFPHQLVRVLFAEQLYRAWSILNASRYHH
jgi:23S rRNA (pseudouridine1915-N3)-methyltransferase